MGTPTSLALDALLSAGFKIEGKPSGEMTYSLNGTEIAFNSAEMAVILTHQVIASGKWVKKKNAGDFHSSLAAWAKAHGATTPKQKEACFTKSNKFGKPGLLWPLAELMHMLGLELKSMFDEWVGAVTVTTVEKKNLIAYEGSPDCMIFEALIVKETALGVHLSWTELGAKQKCWLPKGYIKIIKKRKRGDSTFLVPGWLASEKQILPRLRVGGEEMLHVGVENDKF